MLLVLMQGTVSLEIFWQQFHHLSDKQEEVVLSPSLNDISGWSRTYGKAQEQQTRLQHNFLLYYYY